MSKAPATARISHAMADLGSWPVLLRRRRARLFERAGSVWPRSSASVQAEGPTRLRTALILLVHSRRPTRRRSRSLVRVRHRSDDRVGVCARGATRRRAPRPGLGAGTLAPVGITGAARPCRYEWIQGFALRPVAVERDCPGDQLSRAHQGLRRRPRPVRPRPRRPARRDLRLHRPERSREVDDDPALDGSHPTGSRHGVDPGHGLPRTTASRSSGRSGTCRVS